MKFLRFAKGHDPGTWHAEFTDGGWEKGDTRLHALGELVWTNPELFRLGERRGSMEATTAATRPPAVFVMARLFDQCWDECDNWHKEDRVQRMELMASVILSDLTAFGISELIHEHWDGEQALHCDLCDVQDIMER